MLKLHQHNKYQLIYNLVSLLCLDEMLILHYSNTVNQINLMSKSRERYCNRRTYGHSGPHCLASDTGP